MNLNQEVNQYLAKSLNMSRRRTNTTLVVETPVQADETVVEPVLEPTQEVVETVVEEVVLPKVSTKERFPKYKKFLRENPGHVPMAGEHLLPKYQ